ncbi:phasin family protein [Allopusillimonas ginsengisoli]|uniref:phasin family protein n=1 Tax=Allopusillimonas ginsengisoli TaxID=453575 RepID=UPI0039C40C79
MSAENKAIAQIFPINALFSPNITQAQAHATNMLTQTTELMTKMSSELWEAQTRLMQVEAQQGAKVFAQPAAGGRPGEALGAYNQQLRESSERMVEHLRQVNDLMRDYSWQMLDIYAANLSKATKPIQDAMQRKS